MAKGSGKNDGGKTAKPADSVAKNDAQRAARRVALLRDKLATAMDDPLTRDQIVRAIRAMMAEGKS